MLRIDESRLAMIEEVGSFVGHNGPTQAWPDWNTDSTTDDLKAGARSPPSGATPTMTRSSVRPAGKGGQVSECGGRAAFLN